MCITLQRKAHEHQLSIDGSKFYFKANICFALLTFSFVLHSAYTQHWNSQAPWLPLLVSRSGFTYMLRFRTVHAFHPAIAGFYILHVFNFSLSTGMKRVPSYSRRRSTWHPFQFCQLYFISENVKLTPSFALWLEAFSRPVRLSTSSRAKAETHWVILTAAAFGQRICVFLLAV